MVSLQNQFNKFDGNIYLTWQDEKLKKIREKDESIKEDIINDFKEKGYPVIESFKQGSYITNTTIEPIDGEYDIDVGIVISAEKAPEDPIDVKKSLRDVLSLRNFKEPKIKKPCVTAQYYKAGEKHFHLDYPVYKKNDNNIYYLAVGKEHSQKEQRSWEESDPKGLIDWLNDKNAFDNDDSYQQYKRLIRYTKRWRDYCIPESEQKKIYSIGLSVMIKESFVKSISADGDINDLLALKVTVQRILIKYFRCTDYAEKKYVVQVKLPVRPYRDIFEKHGNTVGTLLYNKFEKLKEKLDSVYEEPSLVKQCETLNKDIFGSDFPIPDDDDDTKSANKTFKEPGYIASPQGA